MNTNHGLNLIYEKLKAMYQDDFEMDIFNENKNTTFKIMIPILLKGDKND